MDTNLLLSTRFLCRSCYRLANRQIYRNGYRSFKNAGSACVNRNNSRISTTALSIANRSRVHDHLTRKSLQTSRPLSSQSLDIGIGQVQTLTDKVLKNPGIPPEQDIIAALQSIESACERLVDLQRPQTPSSSPLSSASPTQTEDRSASSSLLSLDSQTSRRSNLPARSAPPKSQSTISESLLQGRSSALSTLAYNSLIHPPVFITTQALTLYTNIQSLLNRPLTLPEIFTLYATKPEPYTDAKSKTVEYRAPRSPSRISAAIPLATANTALQTAIRARSLPSALSIITASTERKAFTRRRVFTKASPFLAAIPAVPFAASALATKLAPYQTGLDTATFTSSLTAGLITYVGAVGVLGYVALTSANDQMRRVTWVVGMPLWQRWVREDQRRMLDEVTCAFGFKDKRRWGEEEGNEWEWLKEYAGIRGMIVDRVELMEGME